MNSDTARNLKDVLLQYNRITESCFSRCINTMRQRDLSLYEVTCCDLCVKKHTQHNFKVMSVYVEVQPQIVQKRLEDMKKAQQETEVLNSNTNNQGPAVEKTPTEIS